ncbi:MAG TPA: cupin domain-containing protein, partial [Gaiellaceae bacterium]|nr:cupin domain-containing protein [Gaiellaceae bacterium]
MFYAGDTIENPVTGERLVFRATAAETNGELTAFDTYVKPNGAVAAAHYHPIQAERFEVVSGTIGLEVASEKLELGPGHVVRIEPGTPHKFWNAGEDELHFVAEVRPSLRFEEMIRRCSPSRPTARRTRRVCRIRFGWRSSPPSTATSSACPSRRPPSRTWA